MAWRDMDGSMGGFVLATGCLGRNCYGNGMIRMGCFRWQTLAPGNSAWWTLDME